MERLPTDASPDVTPSERLARDLLSAEGHASDDPGSAADACGAVLARLFERLRPVIGAGGFGVVLGRATILAARRHPGLGRLTVPEAGPPSAEELARALEGPNGDAEIEVATRLLTDLLEFLGRLVGWGLTLVLLRETWPDAVAGRDSTDFDDSSSTPPSRGEES